MTRSRESVRIHPAGTSEATVRSELYWLEALRRGTDLIVPEPLGARSRRLLQVLQEHQHRRDAISAYLTERLRRFLGLESGLR